MTKSTKAAHTAGRQMRTDYFGRKADEAYETYAGPFADRTKEEYRQCKTAADLHALSKKCWKEVNRADREIVRHGYNNFTRHGTAPYDRWDALSAQARAYAIEFFKKAKRIEAGEAAESVMPHLSRPASEARTNG